MVGAGSTLVGTAWKAGVWLSRINGVTVTMGKERKRNKTRNKLFRKEKRGKNQKERTATGKN